MILETLGLTIIGLAVSYPLFLLNIKLAPRLGIMDWPKARGLTEEQIPIVGYTLVFITVLIFGYFTHTGEMSPWFLVTAILMALMGHIDDRRSLAASDKFFIQLICSTSVVFFDNNIFSEICYKYGVEGYIGAVLFILGLVNAVNFIDGVDGLAGLVVILGFFSFIQFAHGSHDFHHFVFTGSLLMGVLLTFLYLNVFKRKGFLGNVGSYFFSFVLAVMHLSIPLSPSSTLTRLSLSGLCFLIPISDALMVILSRVLTLRSPFEADKGHLHHRLLQTGVKLRYILLVFALIEGGGILTAYLSSSQAEHNMSLPIFICFNYIAITTTLILFIERASKIRLQGYLQRLDANQNIHFLKYRLDSTGKNLPRALLQKIEARISSEIRITDICFTERPNILFITLKTLPEPLTRLTQRLESIFHGLGLKATKLIDQGEFAKVLPQKKSVRLKRAY